jgi:hypothetical protein
VATTYEFLKDFAGPIATIIAASAATLVTYKLGSNQVSIAREQARSANADSRSAQQKLILDLFDKRWSIVTELREAVANVVTTGTVSYDADRKFFSAANRAALLFEPEIMTSLGNIRAAMSKHKAAEIFRDVDDDVRRGKAADAMFREFEIIQDFYTSFDALIAHANARQGAIMIPWGWWVRVVASTVFRSDHLARPKTVGHLARRRALHQQAAEGRA